MGLFRRRSSASGLPRAQHREEVDEVRRHLEAFIRSRPGAEAFIEPRTTVTPPTVLLVAATGEWTRRRIWDPAVLRWLSEDLHVPVYSVQLVGYPQRMRDWNARQRQGKGG